MFKQSYLQSTFFRRARHARSTPPLVIEQAPSPYYTNTTIDPVFLIIHCIGYDDPLAVLQENKVSCHYLIPTQNQTDVLRAYEVVKPPLKAWQAGASQWKNYTNLNNYSIGIEINMPDYMRALQNGTLDPLYFQKYQPQQLQVLRALVADIQRTYKIPAKNIIGHSDIAPWRLVVDRIELGKTDPGPTLPWKELAGDNIGVWPSESCDGEIGKNLTAIRAQILLKNVGYNVSLSGKYDRETNLTIGAARLHWRNGCYNSTSGLANECYQQPFDPDLACALDNLAKQNYARSDSKGISPLIFIFGIGVPILLLVLAILVYKYFTRKKEETFDVVSVQENPREETMRLI